MAVAADTVDNLSTSRLENFPSRMAIAPIAGVRERLGLCRKQLPSRAPKFVTPVAPQSWMREEIEMILTPKRKPHDDDRDRTEREQQEEELDEALKNTFPASDPVSIEQPIKNGSPDGA